MLLRLVLIGLIPLLLAVPGLWLLDSWAGAAALAGLGLILAAWLYQRTIIAPWTAAAHAESLMRRRLALLQAVTDNAPMTMAIKDTLGNYLLANAAYARQFGLSEAHMLGRDDDLIAPPDAARHMRSSDLLVMQTGETVTYRALTQANGQWRQMETIKYPLLGNDDTLIGVGQVATDVTELAASQEKFARVFHACPDWIVISRLDDDRVLEANEGFERLSGYSRAEAIGQTMGQFNVWVQASQRTVLVDKLLREGSLRDALVQLRRRDGNVIDCMVSASLIALEGNSNAYAVWIARDVTVEHAVNEQFAAAFRLTPDSMSISRMKDGTYIEVNAAFERITGYQRDEVIGQTSARLNIWHNPVRRKELFKALETSSTIQNFLIEIRDRHGKTRDALLNASIFETRGERYLIALVRDVTDARTAERALRESEARFSKLFELSPLPMAFSFDSDDFMVFHRNQAWHSSFGFSPEQSQGKSAADLGLWARSEDAHEFRRLALSGQPISDWTVELMCADKTSRWVSIFGRFIVEQHRTMLVTTLMDMTEQRRAQQEVLNLNARLEHRVSDRTQQLQAANTELQQTLQTLGKTKDHLVQSEKLASLGALVAGVAHELNTPIGNGLTVASTMQDKAHKFAESVVGGLKRSALDQFIADTQFACDILVRNLTRAGTLINSFKQVAVDQTSSHRREFELFEVVSEIIITLNPAIRKSGCQVLPHIAHGLLLDSYPGPLGQVLTNLINNAMVHAFEAGQHGTIEITARALGMQDTQTAQHIEIIVSDNGRGIDPAHLKRIFDPFFTTRLGQGGSGLGLHIVHNIVTGALGGRVEVRSEPGKGAEFVLHLPVKAPALDEVA